MSQQHRSQFATVPVIGQYVEGTSSGTGYSSRWGGIYQGVRPSEHDGELMHFLTDGHMNGVAQSVQALRTAHFPAASAVNSPTGSRELDAASAVIKEEHHA